jgi:hypothetical protein
MKQATFTEVLVPVIADLPSWKRRKAQPLVLDGISVSRVILAERTSGD